MPGYIIPGATPISEWASPINGIIDTCVSAAEAVVTGIYGILPTTPATTTRLAEDQIARGLATPNGASYTGSEAVQLRELGIPVTDLEGSQQIARLPWTQYVNNALSQGIPIVAGVPDLSKLKDVNGQATGTAHVGHGFTIVGVDPTGTGYEVADPNTPGTSFTDYSAQALADANLSSLVIPQVAPHTYAAAASGSPGTATPLDTSTNPYSGGGIPPDIWAIIQGANSVENNPGGVIAGGLGQAIGQGITSGLLGTITALVNSGFGKWFTDISIRGLLIFVGVCLALLVLAWLFFGAVASPKGQTAVAAAKLAAS